MRIKRWYMDSAHCPYLSEGRKIPRFTSVGAARKMLHEAFAASDEACPSSLVALELCRDNGETIERLWL